MQVVQIEADVQRVNEFIFYELSSLVHPLAEMATNEDQDYASIWYTLWQGRSSLLNVLDERPFSICVPAASKVIEAIDTVVPRPIHEAVSIFTGPTPNNPTPKVHSYSLHLIGQAAKEFETILAAELQAMDTYLVSQKGAYRTPDLIERAEIIFPSEIRADLPERCIDDIRQAGRSLALDSPTAAGFHTLRAIESVMAIYYERIVGKSMPTRMRNWGIYIRKLEQSGRADPKITEFLKHIKDNYRNPITHPEVMLSSDEVEVLLSAATSSIRQMVLEIQRLTQEETKKGQSLPLTPDRSIGYALAALAGNGN